MTEANTGTKAQTIEDLRKELIAFNDEFPRPDHPTLVLSEPYDFKGDGQESWPNSALPGVYVITDEEEKLLYIGKASCTRNLGQRLGAHFTGSPPETKCNEGWSGFRFLRTIAVEQERHFEAPAIEEFLIFKLKTEFNVAGSSR